MGRVGLWMGLLALVAVALSSLIPLLGSFLVAPLAALLIGAGAGWWASKVEGYGTAGRGAGAGAIAGIGALLGSAIGLALLGGLLGRFANTPEFQQEYQRQLETARQQNPGATLPNFDPRAIGAVGGVVGTALGFCFGIVDLLLAVIGGLIAGLVYGRNRGPAAAAAAGPQAGEMPQMSGMGGPEPPGEPDERHGARIYRDDEK